MFEILKIEKNIQSGEKWISVQLKDKENKKVFWIDCSLIDGYGNYKDFKTEDLFIDWSFNQYIFDLDCIEDVDMKEYQEDFSNVENIDYFLQDHEQELVDILKGIEVK